ncbi:MAG: DUF3293 domain-containing protein [Planctomycetia bacterium]
MPDGAPPTPDATPTPAAPQPSSAPSVPPRATSRARLAPPLQPALAATYLGTELEARDAAGHAHVLRPAPQGAPAAALAWPWRGTVHVLTAWNPYSDLLPHDENEAAQARLAAALAARGLPAHPAVGRDPAANSRGWAEPSFLVEGLTRAQAVELGQAFEQHALFEVDSASGELRLVACRDGALLGTRRVVAVSGA